MRALAFRTVVVVLSVLPLAACGASSRGDGDADEDAGAPAAGAGGVLAGGGGRSGSAGRGGGAAGVGGAGAGRAGGDAGGRAGGAGAGGVSSGGGAGEGAGRGGAASGAGGAAGAGASGGAGSSGGGAAGSNGGGAAGEGASGGAGNAADAVAALRETMRAYCAAAATCCAEHGIPTLLDDCESGGPARPEAIAGIERGAVTVDMTALERCRAAYGSADACNLNAVVTACEGVFAGTRQVGESCRSGYDCDKSAAQVSCLFATGADEEGVCGALVRAGLDEPCDFFCRAGEDCSGSTYGTTEPVPFCYEDDGLFCEWFEDGSRCRPLVPVGSPCDDASSFDACGSRARCSGTCVALNDKGDACGDGCLSRFTCEDGVCTDPTWAREHTCAGDLFLP